MHDPTPQNLAPPMPAQDDVEALYSRIEKGDFAGVENMLNRDPGLLEQCNLWRATPLMVAVSSGQKEIVRLLLLKEASINPSDHDGDTALHYAAFNNELEIAQLLLDHGADVDIANFDGETAESCAEMWGKSDVAAVLHGWKQERYRRAEEERVAKNKRAAEEAVQARVETRLECLKRLAPPKPVLKRRVYK